jgi:hypothetical protein
MTNSVEMRALAVLLRPSLAMLLTMVSLVVWAGYLTMTAPDDLRGPYIVLLLCQSFSASTGYAPRARRGHFDQLLAGRQSRVRFVLTHAVMSTALGVTTWFAISVIDALSAGGRFPLGLTPRAVAAFVYISALSWAVSLPFSKYSAGVVWLVGAVVLAASGRLMTLRNSYVAASDTWTGVWQAAGPVLLFPPLMVAEPSAPLSVVVVLVAVAAVAAFWGGSAFVVRYSLSLEDFE